ncbi:MAG TPA: hypothetical protein VLR29_03300 [Flavobacterium sp.]|nr:hypothetical protein [Flavobacterium sp.]
MLLALTLLLAVPCSVKRDYKQWLKIETTQNPNSENFRIACSPFVKLEKQILKQKAGKIIQPNTISDFITRSARIVNKTQYPDFYTFQKEAIPSYLLFERFLI